MIWEMDCVNRNFFDSRNGSAKAPGCKELFSLHVLMQSGKDSSQLVATQGL